ncbi:MAG TPA: PspA/IM30 family protein [Thermoanaerobaculia bacterium]|nr:PspA/IM30 family protein [Thermoanaerobaculia bacterium]
MALLERVAALLRANLNDLIDKAEDPEKMIKQVILDMQNQLLQVKTQVAIAIADQHLLAKKAGENEERRAEWMARAELAVEKKDDALARAALERAMSYKDLAENFQQQVGDQKAEVETLKNSLHSLEDKLLEARAKSDMLIARHRRARASKRASEARVGTAGSAGSTFDRMKDRVLHAEAVSQAWAEVSGEDVDGRFAALEKEKEIDRLLAEIKSRKLLEA